MKYPAEESNPNIDPGYAELILTTLRRQPDRVAFRFTDDHGQRRVWTYRDAAERIERTATAFGELGLTPGRGVALLSGPRPEAFTVMVAACLAGLRYVALHPLGTAEADRVILRDSAADLFVVDHSQFPTRADQEGTKAITMAALNRLVAEARPGPQDPRGPALYLFYTGGTTGEPKGVMLRDRSLVANAFACSTWEWPQDTNFLITTPMSHAAGLFVAPGLLRGASFDVHASFDPDKVIDAIERDGVSASFLVPTMLYALLDHPRAAHADLSGLRWLLYGAAPTDAARIARARELFGPILSQHYGQAEAPNALTVLDSGEHRDDPAVLGSCGRAMPGVEIAILDSSGQEVAPGAAGELCARGPLVMDGYWNKPEETAAALAGGWLHTGDVARCDHTELITIVDRMKDTIITGGFNVYPREVEDALGTHPAVAASAVYGLPDPQWGEAVTAAVVFHDGHTASPRELAEHVRATKGSVWAPKRIDVYDALPTTALGKIDKKALRHTHPAREAPAQ
ncbi:AMP-binding protein [Rhodococcus maanshanensis]|uniref:Fatty-acyl-CoA synthase n=1 Tax=Rhodococcus maanshanensis TaxID=183556 RepID=A0A1H7SHF7_9NOCA|nr:AMP-binding protein [Rhodococcus maanshanensis]SEL71616.1 fatty-acyl-CoA synthase [Rhodococcus maanshanensis]